MGTGMFHAKRGPGASTSTPCILWPWVWIAHMWTSQDSVLLSPPGAWILNSKSLGSDRFIPNCIQIYSIPGLTESEFESQVFNSKRFLCFHWLNEDPESRKGHNSHPLTWFHVYDKTGQICFCRSVYFRKANLKPQSNGLYLEVTGELNWHSFSREHTPCCQTRQQPKKGCIFTSSKMTNFQV